MKQLFRGYRARGSWPLVAVVVVFAALAACTDASEVDFSKCEIIDFEQDVGIARVSERSILLKSQDTTESKYQSLLFESWFEAGGPSEPGTIKFDPSINYRTCNACLTLETGCESGVCEKLYLATAGNMTLQAVSNVEGEPVGLRLNEILFEEITLDADMNSILVDGGTSYCMQNVGLSGLVGAADEPNSKEVDAADPQPGCVVAGTGKGIGHNLKDFSLTNCLGDPVAFHSGCGASRAVWMVTTAGWCTACETWVPEAQSQFESLADRGLDFYVYLGSDMNFEAPTQDYCAAYAERKGLDPAKVLMDASWETLFDVVERYDYNFTPMNIVVDGSNMAYVWSDGANDGDTTSLNSALQLLLD